MCVCLAQQQLPYSLHLAQLRPARYFLPAYLLMGLLDKLVCGLLAGLERWSLGRAELAPTNMKIRARVEMLQERGHRLDVGLQDGEAACLH